MVNLTALAASLGIPGDQAERIVQPLAALEAVFRPLATSLTLDEEPATTFDASGDAE